MSASAARLLALPSRSLLALLVLGLSVSAIASIRAPALPLEVRRDQPVATTAAPAVSGEAALQQAQGTGIDIGGVIETVSHHVAPAKREPGVLVTQDRLYRARFDPAGLSLTLRGASQPSFALSLAEVRRGDTSLPLAPTTWRSRHNVARRDVLPGLTEVVVARDGRIEWDFLLAAPLPGSGDLVIAAETSALGVAERSGTELRWPTGAGRAVTMGALVVKDAHGKTLHRALPALEDGGVLLTVPAGVLARAAYPLTLDPVISPEYAASDPVGVGSAAGDQRVPAVAFDGTNYLVAWVDFGSGTSWDIVGARVSQAGTLLDASGVAISTVANDQYFPVLAFDGTNYLVAWQDFRSGTSDDIYGARVSPAGAVLDGNGIAISTAAGHQQSPTLAFDGTTYLVAWEDSRSGTNSDIYGARVSQAGTLLDASGVAISTVANDQLAPALAFDGTNYLVAWEDGRHSGAGARGVDIYGARVSRAGALLDASGISVSAAAGHQGAPALAFDGTNYLVAWHDFRSGNWDIYGARVSPAGALLEASGIAISTAANHQQSPALAFDGTNYLVAWQDGRNSSTTGIDVYGARVSPTGALLDGSGIAISTATTDQVAPALAFDRTNYLVVWEDGRNSATTPGTDIHGARVSQAGALLDGSGMTISTVANEQFAPVLTFDGTNYLVVWQDSRAGTSDDIYGARVSQAGAVLDGSGIAISTAADHQRSPTLAFDGTNYLVAWQDGRNLSTTGIDIYGARVSPAGAVLDENGIATSTATGHQQSPTLAFDGTNYLVAWQDYRTGDRADVYGARVSPASAVLDSSGIAISAVANDQLAPALAFDGTNYLVAWQDFRSGTSWDVYGARVSPAGALLDSGGLAISPAASFQQSPALAFDGTNYLVAWEDQRNSGTTGSDIYGARVSPAGALLDASGLAISTAAGSQVRPALAFDGTNYLVAWQDSRTFGTTGFDIYGARVSQAGGLVDAAGLAVASSNRHETFPVLAAGPAGRTAVAYQRFAPESPYGGAERIFLRFVDSTFPLTVARAGSGSGHVASTPPGIDCGLDCSETYGEGASVTLDARADTGSAFTGWSGACANAAGRCTVTMDTAKSVTATFNASQPLPSATDTTAPALTLVIKARQKLLPALRRGLRVTAGCSEACAMQAKLLIAPKLAKRLKLATVVGKATTSLAAAGMTNLVVKFTAKAKRKLAKLRSVRVTLEILAADAAGNAATARKAVTLRR